MSSGPHRPSRKRRALSVVRGRGRVSRGGDSAASDILARAMLAPGQDDSYARQLTHGIHSYPARMHPATTRTLVTELAGSRSVILDPFCGSGTTLVEARAAGLPSVGSDVHPLAVMIASSKTWTVPTARRRELEQVAEAICQMAIEEGKAARRAGYRGGGKIDRGRDPSARDRLLGQWLAPHVRRELELLLRLIDEHGETDSELAAHLRVALSAILHKVSRRTSDTDKRQTERRIARGAPARLFRDRVVQLCAGLAALSRTDGPRPKIELCDARELDRIVEPASIDLIVTSPPYAGTYDYTGHHDLRMAFLGLSDRSASNREIAARRRFVGGSAAMRRGFEDHSRDMAQVVLQMARALRPGGRAVVVIGDSLAAGRAVRADIVVRDAVAALPEQHTMRTVAWTAQSRPALGNAEKRAFAAGAGKREHILLLQR